MNISFRHALVFCALALVTWAGAIELKADISGDLQFALTVQAVTSVVFCLLANYHIARQRCVDFLRSYNERHRAETAEMMMLEMTHMAKTDPLTGLPNRRFLDEHLERWAQTQPGVAVLMVDIDHFKSFNDTLGHPAGDDCLGRVAAILNVVQDLPDRFVARVGGEEFTIALRHATVFDAARIGTALVRAVAEARLPHPGRPAGKPFVTVSMGLNTKAQGETTTTRLLVSGADEALYLAKERGRNQLVRANATAIAPLARPA
jgi:diguanylate cyclase (GGDEF)-like protein